MEEKEGSASVPSPRWRRILIKLSGEILAGDGRIGLDMEVLRSIARQIGEAHASGCEVAIVVGGGNYLRGTDLKADGMERASADYMGMLGTVINALALQDHLERLGLYTRVLSAIKMEQVAEPFIRRRAIRHLEKGRIIIMAAGTGNPYFSTDTAAVLRAIETGCNVLLKATKVDGVFSADPARDPRAQLLPRLSHQDVLTRGLRVMDMTAITLALENHLPIVVFSVRKPGNMHKVLLGEPVGTLVEEQTR
jgi:uridylate kinase